MPICALAVAVAVTDDARPHPRPVGGATVASRRAKVASAGPIGDVLEMGDAVNSAGGSQKTPQAGYKGKVAVLVSANKNDHSPRANNAAHQ
jgi:hypothetical protein